MSNRGFLWNVYHNPLLKPLLLLFRMRFFSQCMGIIFRFRLSAILIKPLAKAYKIKLKTYQVPSRGFRTLNDFFIRASKPEFRTFSSDVSTLSSPVDACAELFCDLTPSMFVNVKGYKTDLEKLFGFHIDAFHGGDLLFSRLRFSDYHRFHFFDDGEILSSMPRNGPLYSVDSSILDTGLWIDNKSHCMRIMTKNFGEILWLEVGATNVGSITNHKKPGDTVMRGEEKGYFELGGSAVLIVFKKDTVQWSEALLQKSRVGEEYEVVTGNSIGSAKQ